MPPNPPPAPCPRRHRPPPGRLSTSIGSSDQADTHDHGHADQLLRGPAEQDERFLTLWHQADNLPRRRGGHRSTHLHRALGPQARFRYVIIVELDSVETWQAVIDSPEFRAIAAQMADFHPAPGLYEVAVTRTDADGGSA